MNSLIIDCSSGMSIFLLKNEERFSVVDTNQKRHTDELLLAVDRLFSDAKISVNELDVIGVCVGPGSFTGIRVAVSIAKGLAVESKIKIIQMSNFDVYDIKNDSEYVLVLDGFSNYVYARFVSKNGLVDKCLTVQELVDNLKLNPEFNVYVQSEKMQNLLKQSEIIAQIANYNAILCFNSNVDKNQFIDTQQISPVYLRASQAEIERQKKIEGKV